MKSGLVVWYQASTCCSTRLGLIMQVAGIVIGLGLLVGVRPSSGS